MATDSGDSGSSISEFLGYIDKEMTFQGAASAVVGGIGAWILKDILLSDSLATSTVAIKVIARITAPCILAAAALFFVQRARLSQKYGELASAAVAGQIPTGEERNRLIREIDRLPKLLPLWWPYYAGRLLLLIGGLGLVVMLWWLV